MKHLQIFENFIGANAKLNAKKSKKLLVAKEMDKRGEQVDKIFLTTGWFKNKYDTRWRYENPADSIQFKQLSHDGQIKHLWTSLGSYPFYLKDVIQFTSLFKEYPQLKEVVVYLNIRGLIGNARYNHKENVITVDGVKRNDKPSSLSFDIMMLKDELENLEEADKHKRPELIKQLSELEADYASSSPNVFLFKPEHKSALMHEIQHAIQFIESFPSGSSPKLFAPETQVYNKKTKSYNILSDMEMYKNTTGEIEAREVQDRLTMDKNIKRKQILPFINTIDSEEGIEVHWNDESDKEHERQIKKGN